MQKTWILLGLAWCGTWGATAQAPFDFEIAGQVLSLEERRAREQTPGLALAVFLDGQLDTLINLGWRDREQGLPVDAHTRFQVGSMSQPLTHLAVLKLVGSGRLNLDADVNTYLRSWQLPGNRHTRRRPVSIRDLLLETRGFALPYKPEGYAAGSPLPTTLQLLQGEQPAPNAPVRLARSHNRLRKSTYAPTLILQQLLEDVHQLPFPELMQREVLAPLGLTHSYFAAVPSAAQSQHLAVGYDANHQRLPHDRRLYAELAHSGFYTTAADYGRFVQHVFDAAAGRDNRLLSPELAREALTPSQGDRAMLFYRNLDYYWGGATPGFYTQFIADDEAERWVVVVFTNDDLNWRFNGELRGKAVQYLQTKLNPTTP